MTTMPVGMWVTRTADSVLLTCWPPAPPERKVSILRSSSSMSISTSAASGSTATVAVEVWMRPAAADFRDDLLEAAHRAFAQGNHLDLPALGGRIAFVHAEQIAGEERGLVAAGAGADFENDVALVHRVLGNKRQPELPLERRAFLLELRLLGGGHRAHFGIGCRVGDERIEARDLGGDGAIVVHRLDDGSELGELARELDVGLGRHRARQLAFDRLVAGDERIEFWLRNHGCADPRKRRSSVSERAAARGASAGICSRRARH